MINYDNSYRFELLIFETAAEYIERKKKEKEKIEAEHIAYKKEIEKKQGGLCECGGEFPRWVVDDELYMCADCFIHGLQCQADVMVPMYSLDQMEGYDDYLCWEDLWEEENEINEVEDK